MKILIINCSPVRDGATQRIVNIISDNLSSSNTIKKVCIDDYDIKLCKDVANVIRLRNVSKMMMFIN